jgi:hypothetical protein
MLAESISAKPAFLLAEAIFCLFRGMLRWAKPFLFAAKSDFDKTLNIIEKSLDESPACMIYLRPLPPLAGAVMPNSGGSLSGANISHVS